MSYPAALTLAGQARLAAPGLDLIITDFVAGDGDTGAGPAPISDDPAVLELMTALANQRYTTPDVSVTLAAHSPGDTFVAAAQVPASENFELHEAGLIGPDEFGNLALLVVGGMHGIAVSDVASALQDAFVQMFVTVSNTADVSVTLASDVLATHGFVDARIWPMPFENPSLALAGTTTRRAVHIARPAADPWERSASVFTMISPDEIITDGERIFARVEDAAAIPNIRRIAARMWDNSSLWSTDTPNGGPCVGMCTNGAHVYMMELSDLGDELSIFRMSRVDGTIEAGSGQLVLSTSQPVVGMHIEGNNLYFAIGGTVTSLYHVDVSTTPVGTATVLQNIGQEPVGTALSGRVFLVADTNSDVHCCQGGAYVGHLTGSTDGIVETMCADAEMFYVIYDSMSPGYDIAAYSYVGGADGLVTQVWRSNIATFANRHQIAVDAKYLYASIDNVIYIFCKKTGRYITNVQGGAHPLSNNLHVWFAQADVGNHPPSSNWDRCAIPGSELEIMERVMPGDLMYYEGRLLQGKV